MGVERKRIDETIHKMGIPESKSVSREFSSKMKETFFPDDPFRQFRGQPCGRQWMPGFMYLFPILEWIPTIASLFLSLMLFPVSPLRASLSLRDLAVGTVSIASLLLGAMHREEISPTKEPVLYLQIAFTATFFAGVFQASLGILRLGFIIDFLSRATLIGFMAGAAVIVSLQQLKGLLGIQHFTTKMDIVSVLRSVFEREQEENPPILGFCFCSLDISRVSAAAPLTSVVIATVFFFTTKADKHGISIIRMHYSFF